jgi:hypothetical protein
MNGGLSHQPIRCGSRLGPGELVGDPDAMTEGDIAALAKAANLDHSETFMKRFSFTINFRKAG